MNPCLDQYSRGSFHEVHIALGANLGNALATLSMAVDAILRLEGIEFGVLSSPYRTAPIDSSGPDYINAVLQVSTTMGALELLNNILAIEVEFGRLRPYKNSPRTLDLDLLLYGQERHKTPQLEVPHPRMWQRAFVLIPLHEISPELVTKAQLDMVRGQPIELLNWPVS